jgi:coenzyme F420-reducing hydrogenase gamma subunit
MIVPSDWIDRLAPRAWAVVAAGTCAAYGGIHAMEENPTGCMGMPDYLEWDWKSGAGIPIVCAPGCPVQPDNFMEVLRYYLADAVEFDEAAARRNIYAVRPGIGVLKLSAKTGEGMQEYLNFIESRRTTSRAAAAVAK